MSKFRGDRLIKLADFLVEESKKPAAKTCKFDMGTFGHLNINDGSSKIKMSCNTNACALGSAAIARIFPGLKYKFVADEDFYINIYFSKRNGDKFEDLDAAEELFGISPNDAEYLFMPESYPDKYQKGPKAEKYVSDRIYKFVELKEKELDLIKELSVLNKARNEINLSDIYIST